MINIFRDLEEKVNIMHENVENLMEIMEIIKRTKGKYWKLHIIIE